MEGRAHVETTMSANQPTAPHVDRMTLRDFIQRRKQVFHQHIGALAEEFALAARGENLGITSDSRDEHASVADRVMTAAVDLAEWGAELAGRVAGIYIRAPQPETSPTRERVARNVERIKRLVAEFERAPKT